MKAFDFDGTLYRGDSTVDFWKFCFKKYPACRAVLPRQLVAGAAYVVHAKPLNEFKQTFYSFLPRVPDIDAAVAEFWAQAWPNLIDDVVGQTRPGDLVASASPEFLLAPACEKLEMRLIASEVNPATGRLLGPNCRGEEKVRRVKAAGIPLPFSEFYTDSQHDAPMAAVSERSFLVTKHGIEPFEAKK